MIKKGRKEKIKLWLRILLPIACVCWVAFIFSNSLKTSEQSSMQSSAVVETIQQVAQAIAPNSAVATATGEDYELLHVIIRNIAHFGQFAVLGMLLCWCYFVYTFKKKYFCFPILAVIGIAAFDEWLQSFSAGRSAELLDLSLDICGGCLGLLCAMISVLLGQWLYKKSIKKSIGDTVE